jgi:tetratricopeptide (TPR) repeat protein
MKLTTLATLALVLGAGVAHAQAPTGGAPAPTPTPPAPAPAPAPAPSPSPAPSPTGQPPAPSPDPSTMTDDQKKAEAKRLYEVGLSAYNLGNFVEAIKAFSDAYALSAAPGLLFNIAQSHRLNKDYEKATYFYQTYLRLKPDAPNRPDVEQRLEEMAKLIDEQKKMERRPPEGTVTPEGGGNTQQQVIGPVEKQPDPEELKKAQTMMTIGLATGGGGVAFVITGLIFGKLASNAESDLNALSTNRGTWTPAQQDRYNAGRRNNRIAIASFIIGGAAIATGGTFYLLGMMKKKDASVAINPTQGGTTVAVGWSF